MSHYLPTTLSTYVLATNTALFSFILLLLISCFLLLWITSRVKGNKNQLNNNLMIALHVSVTVKLCNIGMICLFLLIIQSAVFIWYGWMFDQSGQYQIVHLSGSIILVILDYLFQVALTLFVSTLSFECIRKACKVSIIKYHGKWFSILCSILIFVTIFTPFFAYIVTPIAFILHQFCSFVSPGIVESATWSSNLVHASVIGWCSITMIGFGLKLRNENNHLVDHLDNDFNENETQVSLKSKQAGNLFIFISIALLLYCLIFLIQNSFLQIPQIYSRELSSLSSNTTSVNIHLWLNIIPQFYNPILFLVFGLCLGKFNSVRDLDMYINQ